MPHERLVYSTDTILKQQQPVYVEVPRYETKYYNATTFWQYSHQTTSSGDDQIPYYPTDPISSDERQGKQSQIYTLIVYDDDNTRTCRVDESCLASVNPSDTIYITCQRNIAETFISDNIENYLAPTSQK